MANILQAAKWMQEGKRVRRQEIPYWVLTPHTTLSLTCFNAPEDMHPLLNATDLLADDWEIAE